MRRARRLAAAALGVSIAYTAVSPQVHAQGAVRPAAAAVSPHDPRLARIPALQIALASAPAVLPEPPGLPGLPALRPRRPDGIHVLGEGSEVEHGDPRSNGPRDPANWGVYTGAVDLRVAAHVMNRAVIGPRFEEIEAFRELGMEDGVDWLLAQPPLPPDPGPWITEEVPDFRTLTPAQVDSVLMAYYTRHTELRAWWAETIVHAPPSLTETMALFWHDHFATEARTVIVPMSMFWQNDLFRRRALGNARELVRDVAVDPAMLMYLDGWRNRVNNPNENFARELLELFTMGEGSGYTQTDVEEVARACTGWTTDGLQAYFVPQWHDRRPKTVLGRTGNWGVSAVVDIIFEQEATARFLCAKLYRWFVDDEPRAEDLDYLADLMRRHDYETAPVVAAILRSNHFLRIRELRGSIIRDGVDLYAGQLRRFHCDAFRPASDLDGLQNRLLLYGMYAYGQVLFDPPNVAGWPGHRDWINTYTLPLRKLLSTVWVDGRVNRAPIGVRVDVLAETARFRSPNDAYALVDDLALLCFGRTPSPAVREQLLDELLQGAAPYDWNMNRPDAEGRLQDLYRLAMRLPDYQLK